MKRVWIYLLCLLLCLSFAACGGKEMTDVKGEPEPTLSRQEQIVAALIGTWRVYDSETVYSDWTFAADETFLRETFVSGNPLPIDNGAYLITENEIKTMTQNSNGKVVQGAIPFVFENGVLTMLPQNGAAVEKID